VHSSSSATAMISFQTTSTKLLSGNDDFPELSLVLKLNRSILPLIRRKWHNCSKKLGSNTRCTTFLVHSTC